MELAFDLHHGKLVGAVTYLGPPEPQNMSVAFEEPLALRAILTDLVYVDLLVPAADCKDIVRGREGQVGYAVGGELA